MTERYGCHNRPPFDDGYWAQKGWHMAVCGEVYTRIPELEYVRNPFTDECRYGLAASDARCDGCKHINTNRLEKDAPDANS